MSCNAFDVTELGPTHYRWRADVRAVVHSIREEFPQLSVNTYQAHPWPGWGRVSLDVWGANGRGWPLSHEEGLAVLQHVITRPNGPPMRHWIFEHTLWTSWGGESWWSAEDHSGDERHVHVTYWK